MQLDNKSNATEHFHFTFRWPIRVINDHDVEMEVPIGNGPAILNLDFIKDANLSDHEQDDAVSAVIRAIAIIR